MHNSLEHKIDVTLSYFGKIMAHHKFDKEKVMVSWTGGKDSTVVLYLWAKFLKINRIDKIPRAITIDTGFIFPEIKEFMNDFLTNINEKIELYVFKPNVNLEEYPKKDVVSCCNDLKISPLKRAIQELDIKMLLTGIRRDESAVRQDVNWIEEKKSPDYLQINPILHWTEMDIWAFHIQENIPYCKLYDLGYRSLDCIPCTKIASNGERSGRNPKKEEQLALLHSLGYF